MNNEAKRQKLHKDESDDDEEELPPLLIDSEVSDDEIPPLLIDSSGDDGDDELPPLLDESDEDELPPLVDSEASSSDDDEMPKLIDSDSDENWEDVSDEDDDDDEDDWEDVSDEDDEEDKGCAEHYLGDDRVTVYDRVTHLEALPPLVSPSSSEDENSDEDSDEISSSSSDDVNFPLFMPSSSRATNQRGRPGLSNILNRQRIRARPPASFLFNDSSDEDDVDIDESDEDDESEDEAFGNPRVIDSQGILHSSSRSGTHNRYWTQISAVEKSKLDTLYRNTEESFKFDTSQSSSSFSESPIISIPIGNGLQLSIHNMEEFLDGIIQVITSHSLRAMEVSSLFEYSRLSQKQVVQNRNILLLLALMLAIKIRYMKD